MNVLNEGTAFLLRKGLDNPRIATGMLVANDVDQVCQSSLIRFITAGKNHERPSHLKTIATLQLGCLDALAVHESSVGTVQIANGTL
jgi:hypothetical protein